MVNSRSKLIFQMEEQIIVLKAIFLKYPSIYRLTVKIKEYKQVNAASVRSGAGSEKWNLKNLKNNCSRRQKPSGRSKRSSVTERAEKNC